MTRVLFTAVCSFVAVALVACGPSYPKGKFVKSADETILYYPDPELPNDDATLGKIEKAGGATQGCTAGRNGDAVGIVCGPVTYVFGPNADNKKVLVGTCLGKIDGGECATKITGFISAAK